MAFNKNPLVDGVVRIINEYSGDLEDRIGVAVGEIDTRTTRTTLNTTTTPALSLGAGMTASFLKAIVDNAQKTLVLCGRITNSSDAASGDTWCTLPVGYRPSYIQYGIADNTRATSAGLITRFTVDANGLVRVYSSATVPSGTSISFQMMIVDLS